MSAHKNGLIIQPLGDTVNVAARLESVPGDYGCMLIIGEQTAALLGDSFLLRELDRIAVKGRATPLRIFEPVERAAAARGAVTDYSRALALYRNRDFEAAASIWDETGANPATAPHLSWLRARANCMTMRHHQTGTVFGIK